MRKVLLLSVILGLLVMLGVTVSAQDINID